MAKLYALFVLATLCGSIYTQTVGDAILQAGCSTAVVEGLSKQLVEELNCLRENLFTDIAYLADNLVLSNAVRVVPFLQTPVAEALQTVLQDNPSKTMTLNSALRTLPQQLMLYEWYQMGKCGIPLAAKPGNSNHNGGLAIDISEAASWKPMLEKNGFKYLGASDPVHYDYVAGGQNVKVLVTLLPNLTGFANRSLSVIAFQKLWNRNNSTMLLAEDGVYGTQVESAILNSPIKGFKLGC